MSTTTKTNSLYHSKKAHTSEVREMVLAGLHQVNEGNTKDFNQVCNMLEQKYQHAALQD